MSNIIISTVTELAHFTPSLINMIVAKYDFVSFPECGGSGSGSPKTLPMAAAVFVVTTIATYALI